MSNIYIVVTHTGTILSRIVHSYTKDEFSHVSISLDKELKEMYSFGRLNPYNAFWGGFVHEHIDKGTFKRFYNTRAKVFSLDEGVVFVETEQKNCFNCQSNLTWANRDGWANCGCYISLRLPRQRVAPDYAKQCPRFRLKQ